jgi:Ca2+-binding EF-hand superfamily protein
MVEMNREPGYIFEEIDDDLSGTLDIDEMVNGLVGYCDSWLLDDDIQEVFKSVDADGSNSLDKAEFLEVFNLHNFH